jgi:hypothetical protein
VRACVHNGSSQAANKKKVGKDDWERKLTAVELRKEDLNQLVMNFLVTEVRQCHRAGQRVLNASFSDNGSSTMRLRSCQ